MRYNDWTSRMSKAIKDASKDGFQWGVSDCCLFSANVVESITGVDYASSFRGSYTDKRGAFSCLRKFSGGGILETMTLIMGEPKPLRNATRGDFVLADQGKGDMLGVCVGDAAVFISEECLVYLKLKDCKTAWGVD